MIIGYISLFPFIFHPISCRYFLFKDKSAHNEIRDFYAHMALTHERHFARCFCRYSGLLFPFSPQEDLQAVQPVQQPPQLLYFPAFLRRIIILTAAAIAPAIRIRSTIEAKFIFFSSQHLSVKRSSKAFICDSFFRNSFNVRTESIESHPKEALYLF